MEELIGDCYRYLWPVEGITMELNRFSEGSKGFTCEITVTSAAPPSPGLLHQARFTLNSTTARGTLARALAKRCDGADFEGMLEQACFLAIRRWREGEPPINLWEVEDRPFGRWLVEPWVEYGGPTTLFADGGSGKSAFALAIALSVVGGIRTVGEAPTATGPALYLDWETDRYEHADRLRRLAAGLGADGAKANPLHYRRQTASLIESAAHIRKMIGELKVALVIVDSLGAARGGDTDSAELTIRTFNAAREFGVPVLFIDHQAKNALDKTKPFGSVYTWNLSRIVWSAQKERIEPDGSVLVGFQNHKANNGQAGAKRGYRMSWRDVIRFDSVATQSLPAFVRSMNGRDKVIAAIRQSPRARMTVPEIRQTLEDEWEIEMDENTIRAVLSRHRVGNTTGQPSIFVPGAAGEAGTWGLLEAATKSATPRNNRRADAPEEPLLDEIPGF